MLPWNSVERLRDHFGDYVLVVSCRHCKHSRELTPAFLARHCRAGWDEPLAKIIARFRCRCGKKLVDVQVGFNKKPRGWVKNPVLSADRSLRATMDHPDIRGSVTALIDSSRGC